MRARYGSRFMTVVLPPRGPGRRAFSLVLFCVGLVMLIAFVTLAVDIGRLRLARSELQTAADASARAGAFSLPASNDAVWEQAADAGMQNTALDADSRGGASSETGVALDPDEDIHVGIWDSATRTFTELTDDSSTKRDERRAANAVMTNAQKFASLPAGGTNCSAPLMALNNRDATGDLVIYVSDNESWVDAPHYGRFGGSATQTMKEWSVFNARNPGAKLVCIDLQPYGTTQASGRPDILNVGGFSDAVFDTIARFARGETRDWVEIVKQTEV